MICYAYLFERDNGTLNRQHRILIYCIDITICAGEGVGIGDKKEVEHDEAVVPGACSCRCPPANHMYATDTHQTQRSCSKQCFVLLCIIRLLQTCRKMYAISECTGIMYQIGARLRRSDESAPTHLPLKLLSSPPLCRSCIPAPARTEG